MQILRILVILISFFLTTISLAESYNLSANSLPNWGFNPNASGSPIIFDFDTPINFNWSNFNQYQVVPAKVELHKLETGETLARNVAGLGPGINASFVYMTAPIMPNYIASIYFNDTHVANCSDYKIFQLPNHPYIGFIITANDDEHEIANRAVCLTKYKSQIYPYEGATGIFVVNLLQNGVPVVEDNYKAKKSGFLETLFTVSLIVIPNDDMQTGEIIFDEEVGYYQIRELVWRTLAKVARFTKIPIRIKGKININLPSCNITPNTTIDLGVIKKQVIEAGTAPVKTANLSITCPGGTSGISGIKARAYDLNYELNRDTQGRLGLHCGSDTNVAKAVSVEVKIDNNLAQLGEKSIVPKYNLQNGEEIADSTLIDFGSFATSKDIEIQARYVKHENSPMYPSGANSNTITPGCANAGMGIILSYR